MSMFCSYEGIFSLSTHLEDRVGSRPVVAGGDDERGLRSDLREEGHVPGVTIRPLEHLCGRKRRDKRQCRGGETNLDHASGGSGRDGGDGEGYGGGSDPDHIAGVEGFHCCSTPMGNSHEGGTSSTVNQQGGHGTPRVSTRDCNRAHGWQTHEGLG